jgi:hypothetical protein
LPCSQIGNDEETTLLLPDLDFILLLLQTTQ